MGCSSRVIICVCDYEYEYYVDKKNRNSLEIVDKLYEVTTRGKRRQFIGHVQLDALACHLCTAFVALWLTASLSV